MNYRSSDYAANKNSKAIVYRFVNETIEVTKEMYLAENPGKTAEDFDELKEMLDGMCMEQDRNDYRQTWKNISFDVLEEDGKCAAFSETNALADAEKQRETQKRRRETIMRIIDSLTEILLRRYLLHAICGRSTWDIAKFEGVNQSKIMKSIKAVEMKIKKVLPND
jgi:hypothetical protein